MKERLKRLSFSNAREPETAKEDDYPLELKGRKKFPSMKGKTGAE
jgi:hypothetical protein